MLSHPATIPLSNRTLNHLAERICGHRQQRNSRWRRLTPGRQALLALTHVRNGDAYTRLAAGFQIGIATAWALQEAIALLSATADDLHTAMQRIRHLAYAILDGTLIPIDRVADQRPYYSGKQERHGVNVQVVADAVGRVVWASAALPGSTRGLTAARTRGIIDALTSADVMTFADKGYQGARGSVRTPFKRRRCRPRLSRRQKAIHQVHAKIRARGERAIATLKTWKILTKLRCCPRRATAIVQAILVLHHVEADRRRKRLIKTT
ncbi:transposase family protein [Plantactinospora sp. B6F1]|uniref:transposase family protein n=1 Tax=Plantactinospora sp. B6F1 TaxID=3158971 RepID=UPI00102C5724